MSALSPAALDAALTYNRERELDRATIETIQRVVGVNVDGELSATTVEGVFSWQGQAGLGQDGKVGPNTLGAIVQAASGAEATLGVWIDDCARDVIDPEYFDTLVSLGFSTIALMVHRSTDAGGPIWQPRWSTAQLEQVHQLAKAHAIDVVLTTWPLPSVEQLAVFARELPPLIAAAGAVGLEVDTEGNWSRGRLDGFTDMDDAARALVDTLREIAAPTRARLELTTYPYHGENCPEAKVAPHMDRLFPQAYSVATRNAAIAWDHEFGPGGMQTLTAKRARSIPGVVDGKPTLGMGLAAYDQSFLGHDVAEALARAQDRARSIGAVELRYWSSKWILGCLSADNPVDEFFLERASEERASEERVPKSTRPGRRVRARAGRPQRKLGRLLHRFGQADARAAEPDIHRTRTLEDLRARMGWPGSDSSRS